MKSIIIVAGPTASGKTGLSIELAKQLGGVIISADSRMVYRGLNIGTGKPTWEHRTLDYSPWIEPRPSEFGPIYSIQGIDHHGLDLAEPETRFTLTDWLAVARPLIADLQQRNIQPIVVGGTGLYLRALVQGLEPAPTDPKLRAKIEGMSLEQLRAELATRDPATVNREPNNKRRLVRALEVVQLTGRPIGEGVNAPTLGRWILMALDRPRAELYHRIDIRLHERFEAGLIDEVRSLINDGISTEWLKSLGLEYRFVTEWLEQVELDRADLETRLAYAIHRYARRQLTYLRHQLPVHWVGDTHEALQLMTSKNFEA